MYISSVKLSTQIPNSSMMSIISLAVIVSIHPILCCYHIHSYSSACSSSISSSSSHSINAKSSPVLASLIYLIPGATYSVTTSLSPHHGTNVLLIIIIVNNSSCRNYPKSIFIKSSHNSFLLLV